MNDSIDHNLVARIQDRTDIKLNKIQKCYSKLLYTPIHLNESEKDCAFVIEKNTEEEIKKPKKKVLFIYF